jgi:hypothetical protein
MGHEAQHAENKKTSEQARATVDKGEDETISKLQDRHISAYMYILASTAVGKLQLSLTICNYASILTCSSCDEADCSCPVRSECQCR